MSVYEDFIEMMKQNNLTKEAVIDVLNLYVNGRNFLHHLEEFKNKDGERREYNGVIFSDEYEQDDEEYFGQNKVLFYSGDGDDDYDIVDYDELYQYLSATCNFYLEKNPEKKEVIEELSKKIKEKYNIK
ncbi:ribonuclease toxin immunity protein CdiI [Bacillus vallismortis]|uniref:Ribonuclease toxin immunity protein CdiI n=1 Tax=Bacillus vallismortis TaxID=72361 RepID=A0ABY4XXG5_BACVA|nr:MULTISPECIES: ribonuclease toxin immunity protein CdiI [Bacillus]MBL3647837.1 hypothetical protein [Bacillus sp. RHFS10]USP95062.1 ribonuclease toxin immunity protein CdiI [Bacillus vallismortis]